VTILVAFFSSVVPRHRRKKAVDARHKARAVRLISFPVVIPAEPS
jgi:hypothetical protein